MTFMNIGIVGAGAMGSGIAQVAAMAGHRVTVFDSFSIAVDKASLVLKSTLEKLEQKGKINDADGIFKQFTFVKNIEQLSDCQLVIEAIIEDTEVKKTTFQALESVVGADCILATNTSSLSITSIAAACQGSHRVLGIHFFNPAPLMALVELIPAMQTDEKVLQQAKNLIDSWGKRSVICRDTPGFIVNRIARPFYGEALRIYDEGLASAATIDAAMRDCGGFRMGPFELMDFIGHDVNFRVTESVFQAFYYDPRYRPSFSQKRLFEARWFGRKSGRGFFDYREGATQPTPDLNPTLQKSIFMRIIAMLINEAADALYLGVATRDDIEIAMQKGVNYPKGLLAWGEEIGFQNIVNQLDTLYKYYGEDRYRCSPWLRKQINPTT